MPCSVQLACLREHAQDGSAFACSVRDSQVRLDLQVPSRLGASENSLTVALAWESESLLSDEFFQNMAHIHTVNSNLFI